MITDAVLQMFVALVDVVSRVVPRIPLGPFAPNSTLWPKLGQVGERAGFLSWLMPWTEMGQVAAFLLVCAPISLSIFLVRWVLRIIRGSG